MEDRPRLSSTITLARILSIAGHPFLLIPLMVAAATRNWVWTAIVGGVTILPLLVITLRNVRRGVWTDHDVSRPEQRGGLYRVIFPLIALSALLLWLMDARPQMLRGFAAGAVMLAIGLLGNRFLKISLHMMAAAFCAVTLIRIYPNTAYALVPFVAAIAWSRHKLDRHTWTEIVAGVVIGAGAAWVAGM
ncbi:MAG TPA: phosphatase PAP2 family protein [Thermoanaerobaculia bacterium]|nr:phosphatase PAP2 family protein [Thermoanaerobaculia bacterium]